jgi:hypothetical protein
MSSTLITPPLAQTTVEKYGNQIDGAIHLAQDFSATQRSMGDFAKKVKDSAPSQAANAATLFGGALMGTFAAPIALLTWGNAVSGQEIKESFTLPAEHISETYRKMDNVADSLKVYAEAATNFKNTLSTYADAVASGKEERINAAYGNLSNAVMAFDKSVKDLTYDLQIAEAYSGATKEAMVVVGKFAAEAVVTVVTMGAMGFAEKAIMQGAKAAVASGEAAETAGLLAGNVAAKLPLYAKAGKGVLYVAESEAVPGVVVAGRTVVKIGKEAHHAESSAESLHEDISEAGQNFE